MTDVKTSAAPAKVQTETKSAAQKMPAAATIPPTAEGEKKPNPAEKPGVFSDPDTGKAEPPAIPPIAERLEKLDRLNMLIAQRDEVTEALETLQKFEQSPNGGQQVIFRTATGTTTNTQNPAAISAMVAEGIRLLKVKLADIDSQIIF